MTDRAKRTGLVAQKVGMTQVFDDNGQAIPVTLLKADENFVLGTRTLEKNGYSAVIIGFGAAKPNNLAKPVKGLCAKANVKPVKHIKEFRVSQDALLEIGNKLSVEHFVADQLVDIQGKSVGKGFAGGMKRHNFKGLEASHGVSISHRSLGSTGQRQDPGKTFKGKKMPGHLGVETTTVQNIRVILVDKEYGLIGVNGSVPGKKGSYVYISDSVKVVLPGSVKYPAVYDQSSASASKPVVNEKDSAPAAAQSEAAEEQTNN
jgi:large subunit ribosomal protein L3